MRIQTLVVYAVSSLALLRGADVLTVNYGNSRTNANTNETALSPVTVVPNQFGKLYAFPVDGQIYAQPLYVTGLDMGAFGTRNVVYTASMHNTVYAFDPDQPPGRLLWQVNLGASVPNTHYGFEDIAPEVGILSTPVIDRAGGALYVVANTLERGRSVYRLHALDLVTGAEKFGGPVVIQAGVPGAASDSSSGLVAFDPEQHLQRPGLLLLNGVVYLAFGSHGDDLPYHGWIIGYAAADLTQQAAVFNVTPDGSAGSIWQAGHGLAADDAGNIYAIAANGDSDGLTNFGESFLRLTTGDGLTVADWFTPDGWEGMNDADMEIGTTSAMLLPGGLMIGGSKLGNLYLLQCANLGRYQPGDSQVVQEFQAAEFGIFQQAYWNGVLYISGWNDSLKAFTQLADGTFSTTPSSATQVYVNPYVGMAVSSNLGGGGILWATTSGQTGEPGPGTLHAFDATDLSRELWNSDTDPGDALGLFAKFAVPTVADGKVYVPTFSHQLAVYGALGTPQASANRRRTVTEPSAPAPLPR